MARDDQTAAAHSGAAARSRSVKGKADLNSSSDIKQSSPSAEPGSAAPAHLPMQRIHRARASVAALFFVNGTTVGSWVPHIPDRAHALGLNAAQLGATLLAGGLGCIAAMPLSSRLIAKLGSRRICLVAGSLFPTLMACAVVAPSTRLLATMLVLVGLAGASMDVSMNAHGVLVEKQLGSRTISLFHGLFSAGCVAGSALTSIALAHHVRASGAAFATAAALAALVLAASPGLLRDEPASLSGPANRPASIAREKAHPRNELAGPEPGSGWARRTLAATRLQVPHGRLLLLGVLTFSTMVSEGAVGDWSALLLRVTRGLGDGVVGYGFTCFSAAMVLGRLTGDRVVASLGETGSLRIGGLLGVLGLGLMLASPSLALMLVGFAIAGLGLSNASPILYRTAGRLQGFDPGSAIAVAVGVGYAGLLAGPPALGFVGHVAGLRSIFYVLMGFCAVLGLAAPLARSASQAGDPFDGTETAAPEPVL